MLQCFIRWVLIGYLARFGFDGLRQSVATQTGYERALVGVSIINKQVIIGTLCVHEGEIQDNAVTVVGSWKI